MLDANIKTQLKAYLEKLQQPIELVASLDDSARGARKCAACWTRSPRCRTRSACARTATTRAPFLRHRPPGRSAAHPLRRHPDGP